MIKLTYTKQMKQQDLLWNKAKENVKVMQSLQLQLIAEAEQLGLSLNYESYIKNREAVIAFDGLKLTKCRFLLDILEDKLNKLYAQKEVS